MNPLNGVLIFAVGALVCHGLDPVRAQTKPFYEGKTLRIIVGTAPGAGNDIKTRQFARHLAKHLPGNPSIIVENMPGGGGLRARNYLYKLAEPDGLTIAEILRGTALQEAINQTGVRFKADKFHWIGNLTTATSICLGRTDRVGANLDEAIQRSKKKPFWLGEQGRDTAGAAEGKLLRKFTGLRLKVVTGYRGAGAIDLAVVKGESDLRCGFAWASAKARHKQWFKELGSAEPFATLLMQTATTRNPDLPNIPTLRELAPNKVWKGVASMLSLEYRNAYPILAPPAMPENLVKLLRQAFWATVNDPEYIADARQHGFVDDEPLRGEEVQKIVEQILTVPEESKKLMAQIIKEP